MSRFSDFAALHVPGDPLVFFNIWDAGSAKVVAEAGAKAIATGSHPVADALGMPDGEQVPLDLVFANARRIVGAVDLPVTIDFEGAYSIVPEAAAANVVALKATGAVGCNLEDQRIGGEGVHSLEHQVRRIAAIRAAVGDDFFVNARTDLRIKDGAAPIEAVIARGKAFADAGASGFFVPRLTDPAEIERVVGEVPLPLNVIAIPGAPSKRAWAAAGVARISHGPFPLRALMATFRTMAEAALG
ncbi:isocitrate lyase/phosphoenolpyruvate mutase family protein [Sphingomonas sp. ASV193]|uniref:isocitrate lyase/PEP mutase family protein n=1 Tax=Sphingomonas sp. ASV193 TaxID=3144405 RepID=UPI0032E8BF52